MQSEAMQFYREACVQFAVWLQESKSKRQRQALFQAMELCDTRICELREAEAHESPSES